MNDSEEQHSHNPADGEKGVQMKQNKHHRMMIRDFRMRFFISLIITLPILFLSPTIQGILSYSFEFRFDHLVLFLLSSIIFWYGGWPFLKGFYKEIKQKQPGMMTLISVAIFVAYVYSGLISFGLEGQTFYWELATLVVIMLLGHWIEMSSVLGASKALEELVKLLPSEAHLIENGQIKEVKIKDLQKGDLVLIKPGESIPADGSIKEGTTYIDESMLTGESKPVSKEVGDEVFGGSVNGMRSIKVEIKNTGKDSYLSKVVKLVEEAQKSKSRQQRLADKAALWLTLIALSVGFITLITWILISGDFLFALERMVTVMVISCPHALGLAIPLVVAVSTSLSAKNGLLIRNRTAFELSRKITAVIYDKTGTLTTGEFGVRSIQSFSDEYSEDKLLQLAYSLETNSEHPIAAGIVRKSKEKNLETLPSSDFEAIKGKGVKGKVKGQTIMIVSPGYIRENNIDLPSQYEEEKGITTVYILKEYTLIGTISLADQIREESFQAIKELKNQGIKIWMLTGDSEDVAKYVSEKLGIAGYWAEVLPHEKQEKVKELQEKEDFVSMVGDGINDAPALAQADVGIAIGSGTDVAAETADIILVDNNPTDVSTLIKFGKATYRKTIQNLFWAAGYNIIAIPLAAGVLYGIGFILPPAIGALIMSLSTVIVAINAKLLKI